MLVILGGVQASGKTTIMSSLKSEPNTILLPRSPELIESLKESPRDVGTDNHLTILQNVLNSWTSILENGVKGVEDVRNKVFILDAGPITTLVYNCLVLNYLYSDAVNWDHYKQVSSRVQSPFYRAQKQNELIITYKECANLCADYFQKVFPDLVSQLGYGIVRAVHLYADPDVLEGRFIERRNDVRPHNMQDWFFNKQDEIATYFSAYKCIENWDCNDYIQSGHFNTTSQTPEQTLEVVKAFIF